MRTLHRQRGWLGLIGLLLALVIVAVLAQKVLKTYGLLAPEPGAKSASERGPRGPGGISSAPLDPTSVPATPAAAIDRARGLENTLQKQANEVDKRVDEAK